MLPAFSLFFSPSSFPPKLLTPLTSRCTTLRYRLYSLGDSVRYCKALYFFVKHQLLCLLHTEYDYHVIDLCLKILQYAFVTRWWY